MKTNNKFLEKLYFKMLDLRDKDGIKYQNNENNLSNYDYQKILKKDLQLKKYYNINGLDLEKVK